MDLEKSEVVDQIEIIADGCIQVRTKISVMENENEISNQFHRYVVAPGVDYSAENDRVKAICAVIHTPEVVAAYRAAKGV